MSEHNTNLSIKEVYSQKDKGIVTIQVKDTEDQLYIVYRGEKSMSVISTGNGKVDQKEVIKFAGDFMKEISTETKKDA